MRAARLPRAGEGLGIPFTPVGPVLRPTGRRDPAAAPPTPEQRRRMVEESVAAQFDAVRAAARGCHAVLAGGYLVAAAPTVAEESGIPYTMAAYCPNFLPSPHHAPPVYPMRGEKTPDGNVGNRILWARDADRWNETWRDAINRHRTAAGLAPVDDVRSHLYTRTPWLAADPVLAPWPGPADHEVVQTGAWLLPDERPLPPELADFLDAGDPPVHFGFGSIRAPHGLAAAMVGAARAHGRRVILSRGWAELALPDGGPDCLTIGEVNQQRLFRGSPPSCTTAARAPPPPQPGPAPPRSSSPNTSTSPTGPDASTTSAPASPTPPAHRPPPPSPRHSPAPSPRRPRPGPRPSPAPCAPTAPRRPHGC
ncbi:vancomycin aglycone glucosyltransferase [Streptomyces sp. TLI_235]|nr:vancomycin aglycone glucosyltransferase [Streptomyces sp. TLI_235]